MSQEKLAHKNRLASSAGGRVEESRPGRLSCMAGFALTTHAAFEGATEGPSESHRYHLVSARPVIRLLSATSAIAYRLF